MFSDLLPAFRLITVMTLLTGLVYPAAVTAVVTIVFPRQAAGSLVTRDGVIVGSSLIGQSFTRPEYFHPRPSAAGNGYDASASSGSNLGPTSQKLLNRVKEGVAAYRAENPTYSGPIPSDAVTASGSGLDPHISPANAAIQAVRVSKARGVDVARVQALVAGATDGAWLGLVGDPGVNVLQLNLALDRELRRQ